MAQTSFPCRRRTLRLLTLACFFHFSGFNNGFSFFALSPAQIQPVSFAPVAIRSLAVACNPFTWTRWISRKSLLKPVLSSAQVLETSSRRALKEIHAQSSLIRTWAASFYMTRQAVQPQTPSLVSQPPALDAGYPPISGIRNLTPDPKKRRFHQISSQNPSPPAK